MGVQSLQAIATLMQAAGSVSQGISGVQAGRYNARVAEQDAALTETAAQMQAERIRQQGRRATGAQRVAAAASGVDVASGSPLRILLDTVRRSEEDALLARWQGDVRATGLRAEARLQKWQGRRSLIAGAIGAGTALTSGAARMAARASLPGEDLRLPRMGR